MKVSTGLWTAVLVLSTVGEVRGEDWPDFRGPTGQGVVREGGLPLTWSETEHVTWKKDIPGHGWSSPIVVEGKVILTTSVPGQGGAQSLRTLCLGAEKGDLLWEREIFAQPTSAPRIHNKGTHANPTPVFDGKHVFVHFGHMGTACLDLNGKLVWTTQKVKYAPVHGNGGTPILVDDLLVFSCDGSDRQFVAALDRATGEVRWQTDRKAKASRGFSFSTPLLITVNGQKQIVSPGSDAVMAYDPVNGKELWRVRYKGYSVIPRPVFGHGLVYVCTGYDPPSTLLAIRPDGTGDVTDTHVQWSTQKSVPQTPSLLLVGDELYMVSDRGLASCLDAKTGTLHWKQQLGRGYSASPVLADGRIYFQSEEGTTHVVQAGKEFKQLAKNTLGERTLASYAAVQGALFLRTEQHLYRLEAR